MSGVAKTRERDLLDPVKQNIVWHDRVQQEKRAAREWATRWSCDDGLEAQMRRKMRKIMRGNCHAPNMAVTERGASGAFYKTVNREQALQLMSVPKSLVGLSLRTPGVDPAQKYDNPIATSHDCGWDADKIFEIEFRKDLLSNRRQKTAITKTPYVFGKRNKGDDKKSSKEDEEES